MMFAPSSPASADAAGSAAADAGWVGSYVHMANAAQNTEDELSRVLHQEYAAQKEVFSRPAMRKAHARATSAGLRHPTKITSPGIESRFAQKRPMTARYHTQQQQPPHPYPGPAVHDTLDGGGAGVTYYNPPATLRRGGGGSLGNHHHPQQMHVAYIPPRPPPRARDAGRAAASVSQLDGEAVRTGDAPTSTAPVATKQPCSAQRNKRSPNTSRMTLELFQHAFGYLDFTELCRVARVSKAWNTASSADFLWRSISRLHKSAAQPTGTQSWKDAFAGHILCVRQSLDHEVAELMNIVKRADNTLKQSKAANEAATSSAAASTPASQALSTPGSSTAAAAVGSGAMGGLQHTPTMTAAAVPAGIFAHVTPQQLNAKAQHLEMKIESLKDDVAGLAATQTAAKAAVDDHALRGDQLAAQLANLQRDVRALSAVERRKSFLLRFQKHVIAACFADSQETALPVAIRRGTDTFAQMELLCASYPHRSQPWPSNYAGFKVRFHMDAAWWQVHDVLAARDPPPSGGVPDDGSVAEDLLLPYGPGSKHHRVLERMRSIMNESYEALLDTLLR